MIDARQRGPISDDSPMTLAEAIEQAEEIKAFWKRKGLSVDVTPVMVGKQGERGIWGVQSNIGQHLVGVRDATQE